MKKKGFTLIELLAVIVILAVIALIVTPIVTGIISEAKESANARSVEGHIKNIEYAILEKAFADGTGDTAVYDSKTPTELEALVSGNDKIKCSSYTLSNGTVTKATGCKEASWTTSFDYEEGSNAKKATANS